MPKEGLLKPRLRENIVSNFQSNLPSESYSNRVQARLNLCRFGALTPRFQMKDETLRRM